MHVPATLLGLKFGLIGITPVFNSYLFSKYVVPVSVLREFESPVGLEHKLTSNEKNFITEVTGLCYLNDQLHSKT